MGGVGAKHILTLKVRPGTPQGSWRPKFILFRSVSGVLGTYFESVVWEGFWTDFSLIFDDFLGGLFDDCLDILCCAPNSWKCQFDTVCIMFEAHRRCGKYAKSVIKSNTFQGCFSAALLEWIWVPFFIDFGTILAGQGLQK